VVRAGKRNLGLGAPEWLIVLSAKSRYCSEDGMSFGVGDDEGYIYSATCRAATPEEAAPRIARDAEKIRITEARKALNQIVQKIKETGTLPTDVQPEGETFFSTATIYGGGNWFVVGPAGIWYVRNNGADGDDWSSNNVRTGGAGAIGWMVPHDPTLEAALRAIAEIIPTK
jgi:hypothetical protein